MILYHGSNIEIERIKLDRCKPYKDFGKGFYLTTLESQAFAMARRTTLLQEYGSPTVSVFELEDSWRNAGLAIREFTVPDKEWAMFVMNNRARSFPNPESLECNRINQYDVVTGPVANDRIAASFQLFQDEVISIDELVERLKYRQLNDQYSFHTERATALLNHMGYLYG